MWKSEEYGTRRCINCGYLGKKDTEGLGECFAVSAEDRQSGELSHHKTFHGHLIQISTIPWCFVAKADLRDEIAQLGSKETEDKRTFGVITKDRNCPS
jgi:Zn ribbon nucleic-acid-binding protein